MSDNINRKTPFVSGKMLIDGINNYLFSPSKNIFLLICDKEGKVLASSDIINGTSTDSSLKLDQSITDDELDLIIDEIDDTRTVSFVDSAIGEEAYLFALSGWSAEKSISSGSILRTFPDLVAGSVKDLCIVGTLKNHPLISKDASFKFNKTTINFRI